MGHLPAQVVDAVSEALKIGTHPVYENPYVLEYAEMLTKILPGIDMIRFYNSGTEANLYAIKAARTFIRRNYAIEMEK
ncbi:MAG: aminotransferase class III-fold pyridoxal phosphate-dependent enzyme [Candidatus Bathyarchaeia archaeon]